MLIIRRIFHISTHCFSCAFAIDRCLVLRPFVAPSFFLVVREVFFIATPYHYPHVRRSYCSFAVFEGWRALDVMFFFAAHYCFLILGAFSRVRRLFALFFQCWLPINTFFSLTFPRCRRSVPMLSAVFPTFHVKHCCFFYKILPLLCLFFTVSGATSAVFVVLSFRCLRVVTRFCAACSSVVFCWRLSELDVVA